MEISNNIEIINLALWLKKEKILVISDLHLGYEEVLHKKGVLVPRFQINEVIDNLKIILKNVKPSKIIINGDLKHEFGKVLRQEWKDVLILLDYLQKNCKKIIIVKGNHDKIIEPIAKKRGIEVVNQYLTKDTLIIHGDKIVETEAKRIIIGHEHPAITIKEKSKSEKYKCFLQSKELIVMPSFNPIIEGTDILKEKLISPYLTNLANFNVFVVSKNEMFDFGKVKSILKVN